MNQRRQVYEAARRAHPNRWSGKARQRLGRDIKTVHLNPPDNATTTTHHATSEINLIYTLQATSMLTTT
ncbi:MAG: hypothetical protein U5L74_00445, partial [Ideonella sp.]|nr:hypothetical protein [Ideonella sp.]